MRILHLLNHVDRTGNGIVLNDSGLVLTIGLPLACNFCFFIATLHMWRFMPGIGGTNHSGSDFMKRVLGPLVGASVFFCAFGALRFWDDTLGTLSFAQSKEEFRHDDSPTPQTHGPLTPIE